MECADTRWLDRLNTEQRRAATHGQRRPDGRFESGPLRIMAGAGTGKTATLASRVAHLVLQGVDPERILLLTFSRRAAQEMTRRAERLTAEALGGQRGSDSDLRLRLPWAGTFHAIGARLLREHAQQVGLDERFGILDRGDAADLMDVLRHEQGLSALARRFPRKDTCLAIYSYRVNTGHPLAQVLRDTHPWCVEFEEALTGLFRAYVDRKQAQGVLDYDDLLLWWEVALQDPALAAEMRGRFDQVLVDEYQDTNRLQARILRGLRPDGQGLTVVGDDAQSIYAFRGADVGNILDFPAQFDPPAQSIVLQTNYRSVQPVLDASNALIGEGRRQYPKTLQAARPGGERPAVVTVADPREQVDWVIDQVLAQREAGVLLRHQAVLFRSSHHADLLEVELTRRNIPYVKHGGLRFLEAAHVKDVLAVLRWADNPRQGIAAFRVLQLLPGMGPGHARRVLDHLAKEGGALSALASYVVPGMAREHWPALVALLTRLADPQAAWAGQLEAVCAWYRPLLEQRFEDAPARAADLDMLAVVADRAPDRETFLTELALDPPNASGDLAGEPLKDEDWLVLSTVHSAKGQEWDAVYVIDVTDGNFPNEYQTGRAAQQGDAGIEEERRLLYVAMTRARNTLHLIEPLRHAVVQQPKLGPAYVHAARSRFLTRSVLATLRRIGPPPRDAQAPPRPGTAAAVDVGARIRALF